MKHRWGMLVIIALVMATVAPLMGADTPVAQTPAAPSPTAIVASQPTPVAPAILQTVQSLVQLRIYGYIKLDASYDTTRVQPGDLLYYVLPKNNGVNDNEFNMTAKETRLGLELKGPDIGETKVGGKIETDFYGPSGTANSPNLRLRLAYGDIINEEILSLRAGQDWDTFITILPRMLNLSLLADAGALGFRRPQLRLSRDIKLATNTKLVVKVAAARTVGDDLDKGGQDDGADTGYPSAQGNVGLETKLLTEKTTKISISGHWGRETLDSVSTNGAVIEDDQDNYRTYSIIGSLVLPIMSWASIQGTLWQGEDLATYYGGIGQGINTKLKTEIAAKGAWAQVLIDITQQFSWNLGYGLDAPDNADLNANNRSRNEIFFTSLYFTAKPVTFAIEYSNMKTSYKDADSATDNRVQGSVIYTF